MKKRTKQTSTADGDASLDLPAFRRLARETILETARPVIGDVEYLDLPAETERILLRRLTQQRETLPQNVTELRKRIASDAANVARILKAEYEQRFRPRVPLILETAEPIIAGGLGESFNEKTKDGLVCGVVVRCWRRMPLPAADAGLKEMALNLARTALEEAFSINRIHKDGGGAVLDLWQRVIKAVDNVVRLAPVEDREDLRQTVFVKLLKAAPRLRLDSANAVVGYARQIAFHELIDNAGRRERTVRESELKSSAATTTAAALDTLLDPLFDPDIVSSRETVAALLASGLEPCQILTACAYMESLKPRDFAHEYADRIHNHIAADLFLPLSFGGYSFAAVESALQRPCAASRKAERASCGETTLREHQTEDELESNVYHWFQTVIRLLRRKLKVKVRAKGRKRRRAGQSVPRPRISPAVDSKAPTSSRLAASTSKA